MEPSEVEAFCQEVRVAAALGRKSVHASTCTANKRVKTEGEYWIRRIMRAGDEAVLKVKSAKKEKHTSRGSSSAAAPSSRSTQLVPTTGDMPSGPESA